MNRALSARAGAFEIAGHRIAPGTRGRVALPVSDLSTGAPVHLPLQVLHGIRPGPTVFVSAALHGDEIIGTEIIRRLAPKVSPRRLTGTLLLVPVVNVFGFVTHSRYLPDRRDLNRSFPGSAEGPLASQLAHLFHREIIARASVGIDIHSAAQHRYNLPQIRIAEGDPALTELALVFGAPAVIETPLREGSLREIAKAAGVAMLLMETGEALRFDETSVRAGVSGVLRVLAHLGMIRTRRLSKPVAQPARSNRTAWLRAPTGGLCRLKVQSGSFVAEGQTVAVVGDMFGQGERAVTSPFEGIVIGHSNLPVVNQGDAVLHVARVRSAERVEGHVERITDALLEDRMLDEDEVI